MPRAIVDGRQTAWEGRAMSVLLELKHLRVTRGSTAILHDISWRVARGEHWVILGPNGCGKTSLLKALTGYLSPSSGEMALLGRQYGRTDWRELRYEIGIVTSALQASIPPAEVALETVVSGRYAQLDLWASPTAAEFAEAKKLLRFVHAEKLINREWIYLSQGERQRVLIARALMTRPRLLILDEPCAGLDPVARAEFLSFIDKVARRRGGPGLVLVTHHVEEITPAITHALFLRDGRTIASGPRKTTLNSKNLAAAFGAPLKLVQRGEVLRLG